MVYLFSGSSSVMTS